MHNENPTTPLIPTTALPLIPTKVGNQFLSNMCALSQEAFPMVAHSLYAHTQSSWV